MRYNWLSIILPLGIVFCFYSAISFKISAFSRRPTRVPYLNLDQYNCCFLNSSTIIESKDSFFLDSKLTLWHQGKHFILRLLELNLKPYLLYSPYDNLQFSFWHQYSCTISSYQIYSIYSSINCLDNCLFLD